VLRHLLLPLLLLTACAASPVGEAGAAHCTDRQDNDDDGHFDCDDPDCQNLDICRQHVTQVGPMDASTGSGGTPVKPPLGMDAGRQIDEDDGGMIDEDDGGMQLPPVLDAGPGECDPACLATEECSDGNCKPVATDMPVHLALTVRSAMASNTALITQECLDEGPCIPYVCTTCVIDPYVSVVRVHEDETEEEIGKTATVNNTAMPRFNGPKIEVELAKGDVVRLDVLDDNRNERDKLLFSCKLDLRMPMTGEVGCVSPQSTVLRRLEVSGDLEAE
jgi:hypothetical protein